jgi:hypothetical protein
MPRAGKAMRRYSQVEESPAKDLEFIKAGFHIGRFFTAAVDTEKDCTNKDTLYTDPEFALTRLNVSTFHLTFYNYFCLVFTPFVMQNLMEHSRSKDQFLRVAIKRLTET